MPTGIYGRCIPSIGTESTIVVFVPYLTVVAERNLYNFYFKTTKTVETKGIEMLYHFTFL